MLTQYAIFLAKKILWEEYGLTLEDVEITVYQTNKGEMLDELKLEKIMNRLLYYWSANKSGIGFWDRLETPILKADKASV